MMVAQHIVHAHGGSILVDSLSMHGTAIHVVLPAGAKEEQ